MTPAEILREAARRIAEGECQGWDMAVHSQRDTASKSVKTAAAIFMDLYGPDYPIFAIHGIRKINATIQQAKSHRVIALLFAALWAETEV